MENAYVDRLNAVGDDDSDYTKVPDFIFHKKFEIFENFEILVHDVQ